VNDQTVVATFGYPVQDPYHLEVLRVVSQDDESVLVEVSPTTRCDGTGTRIRMLGTDMSTATMSRVGARECLLRFSKATGLQVGGAAGWAISRADMARLRRRAT
jgi:hypothetical protein